MDFEEESRRGVVSHDSVVVGALKAREEAMRDGEEWNMFNVRIVFRLVRHDVMNVVASFPPAKTKSTKEVCDDHSNDSVHMEVVSDAHMTGIMGGENKLMPETAEEERRGCPPPHTQKHI